VSIDVVVRTNISGLVNGEVFKGSVSASINTGRGGRSLCEFSELPRGFNPGTFATHT